MMKQALRSYVASLHPRNLKKLREGPVDDGWIYIIFIFCYGFLGRLTDIAVYDVISFAFLRMLFPLALMGWSNLGSKYLMPKAMFLCSMKEEERKEYINCVLVVKIGAMVLAALLVELVWGCFYGFKLWEIVMVSFVFLSIGIAEYVGYEVKRNENGLIPAMVEDKEGNRVPIWMNSVLAVAANLLMVLLTGFDMKYISIQSGELRFFWLAALFAVCLTIIVAFDIKIIKDQYKYVVEQSSDYEVHFRIKGKAEKPKKYDMFAK